jgi:3-oxoadipate enol-lactonase
VISKRDIQIYYEILGKGPRLLYISGTGADLRNKPNIFDSVLADHLEMLTFDQRGLGQTDRPDIRYSVEDYANDAAGLLHTLDCSPCHVNGISFGGMVAQELALRHPSLIDRLVLCCGGAGGHSYPFHEMPDLSEDDMNALSSEINDSRHDADWQQHNSDKYLAMVERNNSRNAGAGDTGRETGAMRQLEAHIEHDTYTHLPEIKLSVFIAGGAFDGIAPPKNLQAINHEIEHSRIQFFRVGTIFTITTQWPINAWGNSYRVM